MLIALTLAAAPADTPLPPPPTAAQVMSEDGFRVGVDTLDTVSAKLGKPSNLAQSSDGTTIATYSSTKTRVKGTTFIPIYGAFAGGAKGHVSSKTFIFDQAGRLKSFSSSNSTVDCHVVFGGAHCS